MVLRPRTGRYKVGKGDCLWKIAKAQYGDASLWREISKSNGLRNPGLILIGQTLTLPVVNTTTKAVSASPLPVPPSDASSIARPVAYPAFSCELEKLPAISFPSGAFLLTLELKGNVALQKRGIIEDFEVSKSGISKTFETETALRGLMSNTTVSIGPPNVLSMTCNLSAGISGGFKSSIGVSDPRTGEITFNCEGKEVKGECGPFQFKGVVGFEAKLKRKDGEPKRHSQEVLVRNACLLTAGAIFIVLANVVSLGSTVPADTVPYGMAMTLLGGT